MPVEEVVDIQNLTLIAVVAFNILSAILFNFEITMRGFHESYITRVI